MLAFCNSGLVPLIPCCSHGKSVFVGGARWLWSFNERMLLLFGVVHGHMKLWMLLFDCQRRLLSRFVRCVSRLKLPIDRNMKLLDEGRLAGFSYRGCCSIGGNRLLYLPCTV